jgi:hypothetical protein
VDVLLVSAIIELEQIKRKAVMKRRRSIRECVLGQGSDLLKAMTGLGEKDSSDSIKPQHSEPQTQPLKPIVHGSSACCGPGRDKFRYDHAHNKFA